MNFGLIGEKLSHSYSKEIHEAFGEPLYELKEIAEDDLPRFIESKDFKAINVTIPYKKAVIPHLDYVDPIVSDLNSCNCIVNKEGKLFGYNTDVLGFEQLLKRFNISLKNKKIAILGTGATSNVASYVCQKNNALKIIKVSRRSDSGNVDYNSFIKNYSDTDIIINTTPKEMYPNLNETCLSLDSFSSLSAIVDVVYNPLRTNLLIQAKERHIPYCSGLYMLVAQAFFASALFQNKDLNPDLLEHVYQTLLHQKENIVLIGMPGCGKSTIGRSLSEKLQVPFYDTDALIEKEIGCSISEFILNKGEAAFRSVEEKVIEKVSLMNGVVISTGGGAVLSKKNITLLAHYGRLYFIDRDLDRLEISSSRPLSSNYESLKKRYLERYDKYCSAADIIIDGNLSVDAVCNMILEKRNQL